MNKLTLFLAFLLPVMTFGQVNDTFSDGNFTTNPTWNGATTNFEINTSFQLHSKAASTSVSALFTPSLAFDNASWECWVKITYPTSSSNYAAIYLTADKTNNVNDCNAYYVQIGGTNDEVSLFLQEGTKRTKIIDGVDKRTDGNNVEIKVRVTRSPDGNFFLYSKLATEQDFVLEGSTINTVLKHANYFGLMFSNTTTTGSNYFFDDIVVTGSPAIDSVKPTCSNTEVLLPNKLLLSFSEAMDMATAHFEVNNNIGTPISYSLSDDKMIVELTFASNFEKGVIYTLQMQGAEDEAGNLLSDSVKTFGVVELPAVGDIIINEIMFDAPTNGAEYIELYNKSNKILDISSLSVVTRKTDGTLNSPNLLPPKTHLLPNEYVVLSADGMAVIKYFNLLQEAKVITFSCPTLNNESATIVISNSKQDTIFDAVTYNVKWHHVLIKNPKAVALERINPDLPSQSATSWHSAASENNFGTPAAQNSQFRLVNSLVNQERFVRAEPESFSPDNDGVDDVCFIHYTTPQNGYVANITIFNASGVKVYKLATNFLLSTSGFISWDGKTDLSKNANPGIYVLYFEMFNSQTGDVKQLKIPIVVSAR